MTMTTNHQFDVAELKAAASGRWPEILATVGGIAPGILDGKHHPCPKCGGNDRFRLVDEAAGAVLCNACFSKKNGDGLAAIMWLRGCGFPEALRLVAEQVGITPRSGNGKPADIDIVARVAQIKKMPLESYLAFGAEAAMRGKLPVARVPVYNEKGEAFSYYDLPADGSKGWWKTGDGTSGIFLTDGCPPRASDTVVVTEGFKDATVWHSMGYSVVGLPAARLDMKHVRLFRGCNMFIALDRNQAGQDATEKICPMLYGVAATVHVLTLPTSFVTKGGDDARDIYHKKGGEALLRQAIEDAVAWEPEVEPTSNKPIITIGTDEMRVADEGIAALACVDGIYQRSNLLVHIVRGAKPPRGVECDAETPRIVPLQLPTLREQLTDAAKWQKWAAGKPDEKGKWVSASPPQPVVNAIDARGQWAGIPAIVDVVETPVLRPDGTVLQTPGFDVDTGIYYEASIEFPTVPDSPTQQDAADAAGELLAVVANFPFKSLEHSSAWLAGVLTLFSKNAFRGPSPLVMADGNSAGIGKGLILDSAGYIGTGREFPKQGSPESDAEMRKKITAIAMAGIGQAFFDNVDTLGGRSLEAALTTTLWQDRELGRNKMTPELPLNVCWFATGNNIVLKGDMPRRVLHILLNTMEESPEEREDEEFDHPELLVWIREERPRLVVAALTILRGYVAAGRPDMKLRPWGSYEGWSALVRAAIVWAGPPDPGDTRRELRDKSDDKKIVLRRLIAGWSEIDPEGGGMTIKAAREHLVAHPTSYEMLRTAIEELAPDDGGKPATNQSVGMHLRQLKCKIVDEHYLDCEDGKLGMVWAVYEAK